MLKVWKLENLWVKTFHFLPFKNKLFILFLKMASGWATENEKSNFFKKDICLSPSGQRCIGATPEERNWQEGKTGRIRQCRPHRGTLRPWPLSPCLYNTWWGDKHTYMGRLCRGDYIAKEIIHQIATFTNCYWFTVQLSVRLRLHLFDLHNIV